MPIAPILTGMENSNWSCWDTVLSKIAGQKEARIVIHTGMKALPMFGISLCKLDHSNWRDLDNDTKAACGYDCVREDSSPLLHFTLNKLIDCSQVSNKTTPKTIASNSANG